jgi:hypothetical protein
VIVRPSATLLLVAAVIAAVAASGCGKKGSPLPPFAKAPAAPAEVSARRLGSRVEIRFTVPTGDLDGQRPANIDRIEVWALTGPLVQAPMLLKYGTLVGTVPVRRPPPPAPDVKEDTPTPPPGSAGARRRRARRGRLRAGDDSRAREGARGGGDAGRRDP